MESEGVEGKWCELDSKAGFDTEPPERVIQDAFPDRDGKQAFCLAVWKSTRRVVISKYTPIC